MTGLAQTTPADRRLEAIVEQYVADGYEVVLKPRGDELPEPLRAFGPDLLVRKGEEVIVVEVKRPTSLADRPSVRELASAVRAIPGWKLDLILAEAGPETLQPRDAQPLAPDDAGRMLSEAEALSSAGHAEAALLVGWSAAEAICRHLALAERIALERQGAGYLLERLATHGALREDDYNQLWDTMVLRNAVAHGQRTGALDAERIERLVKIARKLLRRLGGSHACLGERQRRSARHSDR